MIGDVELKPSFGYHYCSLIHPSMT